MTGGEAIQVAVRVRPFNDRWALLLGWDWGSPAVHGLECGLGPGGCREKQRKAKVIIDMPDGVRTVIRDPENPSNPKTFSFDHSYWSHDGFSEGDKGYLTSTGSKYADQVSCSSSCSCFCFCHTPSTTLR